MSGFTIRRRMIFQVVGVCVFCCLCAGLASAQPNSIDGVWRGILTQGETVFGFEMDLARCGSDVLGTSRIEMKDGKGYGVLRLRGRAEGGTLGFEETALLEGTEGISWCKKRGELRMGVTSLEHGDATTLEGDWEADGCAPGTIQVRRTSHPPSHGAKGMCGAMGTVTYIPADWKSGLVVENHAGPTTWWKDSDGIAPGVAGCHLGMTAQGEPDGRAFGEACLNRQLLVESNPEKDKLHPHGNDVGHPDTFNCDVWCRGEGAEQGVCEKADAPPCKASARCVCSSAG